MSLDLATARLGQDVMNTMLNAGWIFERMDVVARGQSSATLPKWIFYADENFREPEELSLTTAACLKMAAEYMEREVNG